MIRPFIIHPQFEGGGVVVCVCRGRLSVHELLAVLDYDTLEAVVYTLSGKVEDRSIGISLICCDAVYACGCSIDGIDAAARVNFRSVTAVENQLAVNNYLVTNFKLVACCELLTIYVIASVDYKHVGCCAIVR